MCCVTDLLYFVIGAVALKFAWDTVGWLWHARPGKPASWFKSKGAWALVTGCTDGIGEGFAYECARLGFNVVLVSRTQAKLDQVAAAIRAKYPAVETATHAFDFASKTADWGALAEVATAREVSVLVNNVGINVDCPTYFLETPEAKIEDMVAVNITALNRMCHMLLPGMVKRRGGAIVNLSSFTARVPVPMLAVYSATKAYDDAFSLALHAEYADKGVSVLSVCPGFVASSMSGLRPGLSVATPALVARQSLGRLGQYRTQPYWFHALFEKVLRTVPYAIVSRLVLKENISTRARWLRKQERSRSN
ncbi:MAG: SDR family oxidoreductase [archaeon]|nr:SDR family oxidoreductase [archaeon]